MENKNEKDKIMSEIENDIKEELSKPLYIESNPINIHLNQGLKTAKEKKNSTVCPIDGSTGCGKTAVVKSWLAHFDLKHLYISATQLSILKTKIKYSPIDEIDDNFPKVSIVGKKEMEDLLSIKENEINVIFSSEQVDKLNNDTILVIDDYNFASQEVRNELIQLIRNLIVIDPRIPGKTKRKKVNPLMIIVINETCDVFTRHPLTELELKLFGLK